jgi:hypothetical protein
MMGRRRIMSVREFDIFWDDFDASMFGVMALRLVMDIMLKGAHAAHRTVHETPSKCGAVAIAQDQLLFFRALVPQGSG